MIGTFTTPTIASTALARSAREVSSMALAPDLDLDAVRAHLASIQAIVEGAPSAGPIAALDVPERFRWVTSPSSTVIQPSEVHGGVTDDPGASLQELFDKLVR